MPQPPTVRDDYSPTAAGGKKNGGRSLRFMSRIFYLQACSLRRRAMKPTNARPANNMP